MDSLIANKYYKRLKKELLIDHSLSAFIVLIKMGIKLDFYYKNILYKITLLHENKVLMSSKEMKKQEFIDIQSLIISGKIDGRIFFEVWDEIIIDNLY